MTKDENEDTQSQDGVRDAKGRYLPGHSGNPRGMPPGTLSLVGILRKQLSEHPEDAKAIIASLIAMGKGYEIKAIKELFNRIDGKAVETHRIDMEMPVKLVFVPAKALLDADESAQDIQEGASEGQGNTN